MKPPVTVSTENLREEPYASIICYPKPSETELQNRLEELKELGVKAIEFAGKGNAFNIPVLGKGYVGIVVTAHLNALKVALKIRRVDADRRDLLHEARCSPKPTR